MFAQALLAGQTVSAQETETKTVEETTEFPLVISHLGVNTHTLSVNQLRSIFSLRVRNWPSGQPIRVIVLNLQDPLTLSFVRDVLKMLPHQLRRQWDRIIYSGLGQGPLIVETRQDMLQQIASTPGAIGFIEGGTARDGMQVLNIE